VALGAYSAGPYWSIIIIIIILKILIIIIIIIIITSIFSAYGFVLTGHQNNNNKLIYIAP